MISGTLKFHSCILCVQIFRMGISVVNVAPIWFQHKMQFVGLGVLFIVNWNCFEGAEVNSWHSLWLNSLFPFRLTGEVLRDERYLVVTLCVLKKCLCRVCLSSFQKLIMSRTLRVIRKSLTSWLLLMGLW